MKLTRNFIAEQAKKKQADRWTLAIKDGRHEGTLKSVTVDEKNNRCRMLIKPDDEFMLYRPSIDLADFYTEPLCRVFEPFYDDAGNLDLDDISNSRIIFETTTTIGIRRSRWERTVMARESVTVESGYGSVAVKRCRHGELVRCYPEFESVRAVAEASGVPYQTVFDAARREAEKRER